MSLSTTYTAIFFDHTNTPPRSSHLPTIRDRRSSSNMTLFGGLKKTFSRKGSNPLSSSNSKSVPASTTSSNGYLAPQSNIPFTSPSPPTRPPERSSMLNPFASTEAPPPYTPGPASQPAAVSSAPASNVEESDDAYAFLRTFDTVFLIDDSGSMAGHNWHETGKALEKITPICTSHDADGIDIYFLNRADSDLYKNVRSAGTVVEIFQTVRPRGGTPTGQRLRRILVPYLERYKAFPSTTKPINLIVITDGAPSDDVESSIVEVAEELDRLKAPAWQIGIQFFQVGKDADARDHLKYMDDGLVDKMGHRIRDIVDTVPFTGAGNEELSARGVLKTVLGAVNRRLDRNSTDLHRRS